MKRFLNALPFLHNNHLVRVYALTRKQLDPLSSSEIPVEWEAIDQNNSV